MEDKSGIEQASRHQNRYLRHIILFLVSLLTTTIAGTELLTAGSFFYGSSLEWTDLSKGLPFSLSFLGFLTVHEFGHYFTAVYHQVKCSLPYYIPVYIPLPILNIGSFGAVIRIREMPGSRRKYFDIGVAGPLAGFVVSLGLLIYGFTHLPPLEEFVLNIHPEYLRDFGGIPTNADMEGKGTALAIGGSLLFDFLQSVLPSDPSQVPPAFEVMHYPYIFVGYLTLFFTALNLLPIGQLDGGHVIYGLFGKRTAGWISKFAVLCLLMLGGTGMVRWDAFDAEVYGSFREYLGEQSLFLLLYAGFVFYVVKRLDRNFSTGMVLMVTGGILLVQALANLVLGPVEVNAIWLLYSMLAVTMIGVGHPVAPDDTPLNPVRKVLGWLAILIFILCFSPAPLILI